MAPTPSRRSHHWAAGAVGLLLVLGATLGSACSSEPSAAPTRVVIDPVNGKYDVFVDAAEPRVLRFRSDDGKTITVFAEKDETGDPTRISGLLVQDDAQLATGVGRFVELDATDRVSRVTGADGAVLELAWTGESTLVANATSASGAAQVNAPVDVSESGASGVTQTARSALGTSAAATADGGATTYGVVDVTVRRCGGDVKPGEVLAASVVVESPAPPTVYPAPAGAGGAFAARVPLRSATPPPVIDIDRVATSIGRIGARACKDDKYAERLHKLVCGKILPILKSAAPDPADLQSVEDVCDAGLFGLAIYCATLTSDPATEIAGKVRNALQSALGGDPAAPTVVRARAFIRGAGVKSSAGTASLLPGGAGATLVVDFGGDTRVLSAETSPVDPGPLQGYAVKVKVLCAAGKKVTISVVGTDKYTQTRAYQPSEASAELTMSVPGGAGSVRDTITVAIDGKTVRTITIVF